MTFQKIEASVHTYLNILFPLLCRFRTDSYIEENLLIQSICIIRHSLIQFHPVIYIHQFISCFNSYDEVKVK